MLVNCQKEIASFYGKYADKEGITIAEAKKRVSSMEIKAYEAKAKRYVENKTFSKQANEEMRLYNATMRINRLEMLKANIGLELITGADDLEKFMGGILKGRTEAELKRQAGILGKTIKNNAELAHSIVNASFHNATFSDRIWNNSAAMKADLDKLIQSGLIQGKNANVLANDLQKYFIGEPRLKNGKKGAKYRAEVLMRTELARVQTEAQKQSFIRNGFSQYQFIVNGNCCDICRDIANKDVGFGKGIFSVKDMMPGENASPVHPLCRCSTAAYSDRKEYDAWLDYLENGGTTEQWNAKGKEEWEKALAKSVKSSTIVSGAISGALNSKNDADGKKREAHAESYYESMRNRKESYVVSKIAENTGIDEETISKMYNHLFINKYDLYKGNARFDADYYIAESVRRLQEGKEIQSHDTILVMHEAIEHDLMKDGMSYEEAHIIANKSYNYEKALEEWLDENDGW